MSEQLVRRKRLMVGMPLGPTLTDSFFAGWLTLKRGGIEVVPTEGMYIWRAHNQLVKEFLRRPGLDALVLMETDHRFPPNVLERMSYYPLEGKVIVCASYFLRAEPHQFCAYIPAPEFEGSDRVWAGEWDGGQCTYPRPSTFIPWLQQNQLFRVLATGMGCTYISREVFDDWPKGEPYFQAPMENVGDDESRLITDDFWFCRRASQLGARVYVDGGLKVDHLGERLVNLRARMEHDEREARIAGLLNADPDVAAKAREDLLRTVRS